MMKSMNSARSLMKLQMRKTDLLNHTHRIKESLTQPREVLNPFPMNSSMNYIKGKIPLVDVIQVIEI